MCEAKEKTYDEIAAILERPLTAAEIEWRPSFISKKQNGDVWARLLPYKTSRIDKQRLDEALGKFNWTSKFFRDSKGALFCEIAIKLGSEWIARQDCGQGDTHKAEATDAFKRACFQFGIGQCLYAVPEVWVKLHDEEYYHDKSGNIRISGRFQPQAWDWCIENSCTYVRVYQGEECRYDSEKFLLRRAG